ATMNSKAASMGSKERVGMSQFIVTPLRDGKAAGKPFLQQKFNPGVIEKRTEWVQGKGYVTRMFEVESGRYDDKRFRLDGIGHFHRDVTGKGTPGFSKIDIGSARTGVLVYKANESSPNHVERLTPQTDGSEPQSRSVSPPPALSQVDVPDFFFGVGVIHDALISRGPR